MYVSKSLNVLSILTLFKCSRRTRKKRTYKSHKSALNVNYEVFFYSCWCGL